MNHPAAKRTSISSAPIAWGALSLGLLLLAPGASARTEAGERHPDIGASRTAPTTCTALSGDEEVRADNAVWRESRIDLRATGSAWEIWARDIEPRAPTAVQLTGMSVVDVADRHGALVAHVQLDDALAEVCGQRVITLSVDDAIGHGLRVVGVSSDGLLIARGRTLRFVAAQGHKAPSFDLVYRSSFEVVAQASSSAPTASVRAPSRASRRSRR